MTSHIMEEGDTGEAILPGLERELSAYLAADRAEPIVDPNMAGLNYGVVGDFSAITAEARIAELEAENERLKSQEKGQTKAAQSAWRAADKFREDLAKERARASAAERALADERAKVADYESRITWHTTCKHCAETTDFAYSQTVRAEKAEEKVARVEAKRDEFQRTAKERYAARQYEAASIYTTAHQGITFALAEPDDDASAETSEVS